MNKLIANFLKSITALFIFIIISCQSTFNANSSTNEQSGSFKKHPEWSSSSTIYEVNIRQFTHEGTFQAFTPHLSKLKEMGIDIVWLMPIHPIGKVNRKGSLGSYYSVQDYKAVNPEFGTIDDFKKLVKEVHSLGMYLIIDWVANHTSWDNVWTTSHPEFFTKDANGNYVSPYDWTDVIDLNYDNKELWNYMYDAMNYWVEEFNIDGFRCDVAAMVPLKFWNWVIPKLEKHKKLFLLAEAHEPELHQAFDMTYNWQLKDIFVGIAKGEKNGEDLHRYFKEEKSTYPKDAYRMTFTTNHDENSWHGTDTERYGDFAKIFAVISSLVNGMPLVYSGMEGGLNKRLQFFEKDPIEWKQSDYRKLYTYLFKLKKENKALWNGAAGGEMKKIDYGDPLIFSFLREKDDNKVFAIFNLSRFKKNLVLQDTRILGDYINYSTGEKINLKNGNSVTIEPLDYIIFHK